MTRRSIKPSLRALFIAFWLNVMWTSVSLANDPVSLVEVIISSRSKAYAEAAAGLQESFSAAAGEYTTRIHYLEKGDPEAATALVQGIAKNPPALAIAIGTRAAKAVREHLQDIPIVYGLLPDANGFEDPSRAVVLTTEIPIATQLDWVRRVLPNARNVGVVYQPDNSQKRIDQARAEAKRLGIKLISRKVQSPSEIPDALASLSREIDVLWGLQDRTVISPATAKSLLVFSYRNKIPFVGLSKAWVKAGALYALDRNYREMGAQSAEIGMEIIRSGEVKEPTIRFPERVVYSLNSAAADHMKLKLDPELLENAENVHH